MSSKKVSSLFAQADTTFNMEENKSSGRGRKRKTDDSNLSPEEQEKKRKNRDAAKKCREKKEKEAQELKMRNNELETENSNLSKEKIKLLAKINEFKTIIHSHIDKGCKLPPDIEQVLLQDGPLDDDFREVGVIESPYPRMQTPPHTPDSSSSDKLSPPVSLGLSGAAPTALFSGTILPHEACRRKSSSSSRSPSRSPGPQGPKPFVSTLETKDLSHHLLTSKNLPAALNPIQLPTSSKIFPNITRRSQVPTVIIDDDDDDDDVQVCSDVDLLNKGKEEHGQSQKLHWIPVSEKLENSSILSKAFEHPDIPSEDVISNQLFEREDTQFRIINNQAYEHLRNDNLSTATEPENLQSLGFNSHVPPLPEGYSYTEDLAEVDSVNNITVYTTTEAVQYVPEAVYTQNHSNTLMKSSLENNALSHEIHFDVISPAILALGSNVSDTLQEQIKKQFPSSEESQQLEQQDQYVNVSTASHQNSIISRAQQSVATNYINAGPSNEIASLNNIAASKQDSQLNINGQKVIATVVTHLGRHYILENEQIVTIHTAKVLQNPVQVNKPNNQVLEQFSANAEQDQQSSNVEFNLPSLNFEDLKQNGNIFDKTKSKNSTSS